MLLNKKGDKKWNVISKIVAVFMLTSILTLLTGAVLDIGSKRVTLVRVDAFSDSENTQKFTTRQEIVSEFLAENNIEMGEFDKLSMLPEDKLYDGARLIIRTGRKFTLSVDGNVEIITTTKKTVREAFEEAGVSVDISDRVEPSLDAEIEEDMHVNVFRVAERRITVDEEIPFSSKEVSDSSLKKGTTKIKTKGQNGLKRVVYDVTTENGIEVKRQLVSSATVKKPVTQIVAVGTGENKKSSGGQKVVATNAGKSLSYSKKLTVTATAYTDSSGNKTASGRMPQYGVIAVDPKVIPLGTKLYVESTDDGKSWTYGYCVAGDTGGAIKGNKIDLFYNSEGECVRFGRRTAIVYILD